VGQNASGIIVAFRGTLPPNEPDSYLDWLQDLFVEPVAYKGLPGKVHQGFLDAVNPILQEVVSAVSSLKPSATNPVYITGHSKGGGMAPIAAYLVRQGAGIPTPFQDVIEVLHRSMLAGLLQSTFCFELHNRRRITGMLVGVD
jgi:hypothetical protein